jgi:hypothetical protein
LCSALSGVAVGKGDVFVTSFHGKKMEEGEQWAREEEERTMRCEVEEEGRKIKGEGGAGWQWGTSCSASLGVAVGERDVVCKPPQKKRWRRGKQWAREEEEWTMRHVARFLDLGQKDGRCRERIG